jgi:hypothetical protein
LSLDPFARQKLLPEVGESGQELLGRAAVAVPSAQGGQWAADYLRRAGVGQVESKEGVTAPAFPHAACFRYGPSGELGFGTWLALDHLRSLLRDASK